MQPEACCLYVADIFQRSRSASLGRKMWNSVSYRARFSACWTATRCAEYHISCVHIVWSSANSHDIFMLKSTLLHCCSGRMAHLSLYTLHTSHAGYVLPISLSQQGVCLQEQIRRILINQHSVCQSISLRTVVPKVYSLEHKGSANIFQEIHGYISIIVTFILTYFLIERIIIFLKLSLIFLNRRNV